MNQDHKTEAKRREARSGKLGVQRIDPERLRKAIQYLGEHPAIPTRAPLSIYAAYRPEKPTDALDPIRKSRNQERQG